MAYLIAAALTLGMTATPLPFPPSWLILGWIALQYDANLAGMVIAGALGAAAGRTILCAYTRVLGPRLLGSATQDDIERLGRRLANARGGRWGTAALLVVSPPPAGALYTAAGLLRVPLAMVAACCAFGRVFAYGMGIALTDVASRNLSDIVGDSAQPWTIASGLLLTGTVLWLVIKIDWLQLVDRRRLRLRRRPSRQSA